MTIVFVYRANYFPRWMNASCKECQPVKVENQDEPFLYTFLFDIMHRPELREKATHIQTNLQRVFQNVKKQIAKFKKYKFLWKADKVCTLT